MRTLTITPYTSTAVGAGILAATWWNTQLNHIATVGDGYGPLGMTAITATAAYCIDRARPGLWIPRAALATTLIAPAYSLPAAQPVAAFLTGATL